MLFPINIIFELSRNRKRIITLLYDASAILFSLYLSVALRLEQFYVSITSSELLAGLVTTIVTIFCFIRFGMYRAVLRYMTMPALGNIFLSVFISALTLSLSGFFFHAFIPRSIPFIYAGIAILTLAAPRILFRGIYYQYYKKHKKNVFIYGAGSTGRELLTALIQGEEYHPVAIIDDDKGKKGQIISGVRVHHSSEIYSLEVLYKPEKILLAINNISYRQRLSLLEKLSEFPIEVQSVPSVMDIAAGRAKLTEVRDLDVADLLGREPVEPDVELLKKNIKGKNVMVTGAGGSIGSELCRSIIIYEPNSLVLFELNEFNLYKIERELRNNVKKLGITTNLVACLGSVQKKNRISHVIRQNKINTIYHSAAYKHVPMVENNIVEGIRNNVFGTLAVAEAAMSNGVDNFTLISTDKAVRPTNVMGASKRMAELVLQSLADISHSTVFTMVRFGNVLGSSGSVVPLFKQQIKDGGPVTVTHPDITRYFMLIPEAAQLVIQAGALGQNGQVFVLDMGEPVKILDLAKRMIHLMGYTECIDSNSAAGDIVVKFIGLRPGEKLYEELLIGSNVQGTKHKQIMTACEDKMTWSEMERLLADLDLCCHNFDEDCIVEILKSAPTGYTPRETHIV